MSVSALENEDLENVPLVRMEDVQPSRDRIVEPLNSSDADSEEVFETCIIDNIKFENECVVENDDNSSGDMVSVQSDYVGEESGNGELIVPELLNSPLEVPIDIPVEVASNITMKATTPDQWPTLEILPGGVIKHATKVYNDLIEDIQMKNTKGEMTYACAQCSQTFKYLYCLVKHVKWHTDQKKRLTDTHLENLKTVPSEKVCLHSNRKKVIITKRINKRRVPKRLTS